MTWRPRGSRRGLAINSGNRSYRRDTDPDGRFRDAEATITLNDTLGDPAATRQYTVTINAAPSITTASPLPNGNTGVAYSTTLASSGGTAPLNWSATSLPSLGKHQIAQAPA